MKCKWSPVSTVLSVFILIALAVLFSRKSFLDPPPPPPPPIVTPCNKPDVKKHSIKLGDQCCSKKPYQCALAPDDRMATCAIVEGEQDPSKPDKYICI